MRPNRTILFSLFIIALFSIPLILPLMHSGFFKTDDGDVLIIRLSAFHEAIIHGQFPPRFLPRLYFGYGYPVSNFLYPGYLYLGEVLHLIRFGFINSVKIILILSIVCSGFFSFAWLRRFGSIFASLCGSFIYMYFPYHYYDIYKRGSVGEVLALAVIPFAFWMLERRNHVLVALGIALLIISHNTLAIFFLPIILLYHLFIDFGKEMRAKVVSAFRNLMLGLGLSAFFWLPAVSELKLTVFKTIKVSNISDYFIQPDHRIFAWMSLYYLVLVVALFLMKQGRKKDLFNLSFFNILAFMSLGSLLLNLPQSLAIWNILPLNFIQFPFRLLAIPMLFFAYGSVVVLKKYSHFRHYVIGLIFSALVIAPIFWLLRPVEYSLRDDMYYASNEDSTTIRNEYLPLWVREKSLSRAEKFVEGRGIRFKDISHGNYNFTIDQEATSTARVNMLYYPGWQAESNGVHLAIAYDNPKGVMDILLPPNVSKFSLRFTETPLRLFSDLISMFSVFYVAWRLSINFMRWKKK